MSGFKYLLAGLGGNSYVTDKFWASLKSFVKAQITEKGSTGQTAESSR